MSAFKKIVLICLAMALLGMGFGIFVAFQLEQRYTIAEPNYISNIRVVVDPRSFFPDRDVLYVLILGTDYNYTQKDIMYTKNSRSDTSMVARLDLTNRKLRLLSVPRDLRVQIPGEQGYDKINDAIAIGGPKLAETVFQNVLGIPMDYYVRIKEEGLKKFVDAIGGINLYVEKNMNYDDTWGHLHIHLKKGYQHLNGENAAEYSRFRHDETGDYGRIERQQKEIKAIQERFHDPAVLARLPQIAATAKKSVETNLRFPQLLALVNLFKGVGTPGVETMTLPTVPQDVKEGGYWVSYVIGEPQEDQQTIQRFTAPESAAAADAAGLSIEVLNGSGIAGKAQEVAEKLRASGFVVARVSNADRFDYNQTRIVDHTNQGEGNAVAKILGIGTLTSQPQDPRQFDITVIVGRD